VCIRRAIEIKKKEIYKIFVFMFISTGQLFCG
jgi:hypothetical protein